MIYSGISCSLSFSAAVLSHRAISRGLGSDDVQNAIQLVMGEVLPQS